MAPELKKNEQELRETLESWRESAHSQAERADWFWNRQHTRIMAQIKARRVTVPKLAWAGIAATVAVAVSLMIPGQQPKIVKPPVASQRQISDHELMLALERTMNAGVPASLEPAGLLAQEMDQAYQQNQAKKSKETKYAN